MTNQHRATPEEWATAEKWAAGDGFGVMHACLLELRDRIQQLEAAQQQLRSKLRTGLLFKTETTYGEASDHARRLVRDANSIPVTVEGSFELNGKNYTYKGQAEPAPSCQPPALVWEVARLIARFASEGLPGDDAKPTASAAIRAVASWLRSEYPRREGCGTAWAKLLDDHADR